MMKAWSLLFFAFCLNAHAVEADQLQIQGREPLPLYEIGVGAASVFVPDYPGSNQSHVKTLPIPYAVYRGEILHSDREEGTRARFFHTDELEINLSGGGGFPTNSNENEARRGMPNLDWTLEVGPRVSIRLYKFESGAKLKLGLPIRSVFSTDFGRIDGRGFLFAPELRLELPDYPHEGWKIFVDAISNFADRRYSQYFYEVEPIYARVDRGAYQAHGGYFSSDIAVGAVIPIVKNRLQLVGFIGVSNYSGSSNASSPLMKSAVGNSEAIALIWTFVRSSRIAQEN